jgi:predicted PhzF superfamily epimerase YddE/YHI9
MRIPNLIVDAFVSDTCRGNPAAVCPLDAWLDEARMQAIAAKNALPETAFFVPKGRGYALRWFSPTIEVALCGHATLAAAFVVFERLAPGRRKVSFATRSGTLSVARAKDLLVMDFPSLPPVPIEAPPMLEEGLGAAPSEAWRAANILAVFDDAGTVRDLTPDFEVLKRLHPYGVIATAPGGPGDGCDFVSRYFGPSFGIPEDPVTGSAHCTLIPYWAERLGKAKLVARQVSARGGELICEDKGERVAIGGRCRLASAGEIDT